MSDMEPREPRVYELGYHFLSTIGDNGVGEALDRLKKTLADHGCLEIAEGKPYLTDLAYPMEKIIENKKHTFAAAYFGWVKFDVSPEKIEELQAALDANMDILRYLLISTVREDTMAKKRPMRPRSESTDTAAPAEKGEAADEAPKEEPQEVNEEELDEKLGELVTDES